MLVTKSGLTLALENLKFGLTIRLGSMIVAGIVAMAVLQGLH
ncbi:hypothetical protein [Bradyrhizobium sp. B117]